MPQAGFWGSPRSSTGAFLDSSQSFTFSGEGAAFRPSHVITVPIDFSTASATCDIQPWANAGDAAAVATFGVDLNAYTFK